MHLTSAFGNNDMMTQAFKILMLLRTTFTLFYFDSPLAKEGKGGGLRPKKKKRIIHLLHILLGHWSNNIVI